MSPKKLLVLGPALLSLAPCAGAEAGMHSAGLGVGATARTVNRCGALSSQALCVRARGGAIAEELQDRSQPRWMQLKEMKSRGFLTGSGNSATGSGSSSSSSHVSGEATLKRAGKRAPLGWEEGATVTCTLRATTVATVTRGGAVSSEEGPPTHRLVPDNPQLRGAGVLALAGLGSGVLYALASNNLLRADWPIPFVQPWQVLTAATWWANMAANRSTGRLDGNSVRNSSNGGGGKNKKTPVPPPIRFFTPAGWAFAIWGPIFLGEFLFVLLQLLPVDYVRESWWLSDISPWFAGAMLFQSLWCASFRPWARDAGLLWVPTLMLGSVAVALGGVHGILRTAWFDEDMDVLQYLVAHVPISLHFGWISCASLVNLNGYFASIPRLTNRFKLVASVLTIIAATVLGAVITRIREDPLYVAVLAWALWAVGSPAGWSGLEGRIDPGDIRLQELTAKGGSILAMAAVCLLLGASVKDKIILGNEE
eukprot:jgi/Undpi1/5949/HiC_scaffold_2.g01223.m1